MLLNHSTVENTRLYDLLTLSCSVSLYRECLFYGSQVRPLPCGQYHDGCNGVTAVQLAVILFSLGLISIGAGFVRPCSIAREATGSTPVLEFQWLLQ